MEKLSLQIASEADADDYIALEKKVGGPTYHALASKEEFLKEISEWKTYLFKLGGKIIGHISFQTRENGSVHFGGLAIDPEYQGKSYGRQASELVAKILKNVSKFDLVVHPDNIKAINLYKSFGFEIIERQENYYGDGQPRVILEKHNKKI